MMKKFLTAIGLFLLAILVVGCRKPVNVKITFNAGDGTFTETNEKEIVKEFEKDKLIDKTKVPEATLSGSNFIGWEMETELINLDEFKPEKDSTLVAQFEAKETFYKISFEGDAKEMFSLDETNKDLDITKLKEGMVVKFLLTPKKHTKISAVYFNEKQQATSGDNKYSLTIGKEDVVIKVSVEETFFKVEAIDKEKKLEITGADDLTKVKPETKLTLTLGEKDGYGRKLFIDDEEVLVKDNTYTYVVKKDTKIELKFYELIKLAVDPLSQDKITFVNKDIDKTKENLVNKNTKIELEVDFDIVNEYAVLTIGDEEIILDVTNKYDFTILEETTISIEIKIRQVKVNLKLENALDSEIEITLEDGNKVDLKKEFDINTKINIKLVNLDSNFVYTLLVDGKVIPNEDANAGISKVVSKNLDIELRKTDKKFKVVFEITPNDIFVDANLEAGDILNKDEKLKDYEVTAGQNDYLDFKYSFRNKANNDQVFVGFNVKGKTDKIFKHGDLLFSDEEVLTLVPCYSRGFWRIDKVNNVFFVYQLLTPGKAELIRLGNLKEKGTDNYLSPLQRVKVPKAEYFNEEYYDVVSIADNATIHLNSAKEIDLNVEGRSSIRKIGKNNFSNISDLEYFMVHKGLLEIGSGSLLNLPSLKTIDNNGVKYIDNNGAKEDNYVIAVGLSDKDKTSIELHKNTKVILEKAFSGEENIEEVKLNYALNQIGQEAFSNATKLSVISYIDGAVNENKISLVGNKAFSGTKLTKEAVSKVVKLATDEMFE